MRNNKRCILIADDEPKMTRALQDYFRANEFDIITVGNGEEALRSYYENTSLIDLIILDVMMPKKNGIDVLKEIRRVDLMKPIILLTAKSEEYDQIYGLSSGADDYVTKPFSPALLLAKVEAVLRRFGKDSVGDIKCGGLLINSVNRKVYKNNIELELTRREYDLLYYLVINQSITFEREKLLDVVWGYDFEGGSRTVDTHIRQLRNKLGEYADYIKTVHCVGYKFEVDDEDKNP